MLSAKSENKEINLKKQGFTPKKINEDQLSQLLDLVKDKVGSYDANAEEVD